MGRRLTRIGSRHVVGGKVLSGAGEVLGQARRLKGIEVADLSGSGVTVGSVAGCALVDALEVSGITLTSDIGGCAGIDGAGEETALDRLRAFGLGGRQELSQGGGVVRGET